MNKICTSLEQSQRLIDLGVDVNTSDMYWNLVNKNYPPIIGKYCAEYGGMQLPAWSLTTLLGLMPFHLIVNNQRYAFSMHKGLNKDGETYMFRYNIFNTDICLYSTDYYNNSIDAAFEMVCWLKENNKI